MIREQSKLTLSGSVIRAALGIIAIAISITALNVQPITSTMYGLQITVKSNFPVDITIKSVEAWAYVNSQLVAYGITTQPITIKPYQSASIIGTVEFYTPLSELQKMPNETPIKIVASINYKIFMFISQEIKPEVTMTLGELLSQFS